MNEQRALITVASWEERFRLGTERIVRSTPLAAILMFYYREYSEWSLNNRKLIKELCATYSIRIDEIEVCFDLIEAWQTYDATLHSYDCVTNEIIFDFTTAPREAMWTLMYFLTRRGVSISYVYHTPESYNAEWLSRDPGEPRLMFKMSGLQDLRKPTVLLIVTGFDPDRTAQLVTFYEPKLTLLAMQSGGQYDNMKLNVEQHEDRLKALADIDRFEIDVYSQDHGFAILETKVVHHKHEGNLVLSSLGPKPSAIALFNLWRKYPEAALAYAPSNEYNKYYSRGIGQRIVTGQL